MIYFKSSLQIIMFVLTLITVNSFGQSSDLSYNESSKTIIDNEKSKVVGFNLKYVLGYYELQAKYCLTDKYFIYITFSANNSTDEIKSLIGNIIIT